MSSKARSAFDKSSEAVEQLLAIHKDVGGSAPGRRKLEVLNKSAIVLITALWEAYCEDLAAEALAHIVKHAADASSLPLELRKRIAKEVKEDKHDLAPWTLADDSWRKKLQARLGALTKERNTQLNTPKTAQINTLFEQALGLTAISRKWEWRSLNAVDTAKSLDAFVSLRGSIAHRWDTDKPVHKKDAENYLDLVKSLIKKTGGAVNTFVKTASGKSLW